MHDWSNRRSHLGELIYSTRQSNASSTQSGSKRYEAGQILEFDDVSDAPAVDVLSVDNGLDVRHDTNLLDYEALGISGTDLTDLLSESDAALRSLSEDLNAAIKDRLNAEADLATNQHLITELHKAIGAIEAVLTVSSSTGLAAALDGLVVKLAEAETERDELTVAANEAAAEATVIRDKIVTVSQLVR